MENFIERQRTAINNAKINMDKAFGDLGSMTGWDY
jgi:hypothetical protein